MPVPLTDAARSVAPLAHMRLQHRFTFGPGGNRRCLRMPARFSLAVSRRLALIAATPLMTSVSPTGFSSSSRRPGAWRGLQDTVATMCGRCSDLQQLGADTQPGRSHR